MPETQWLAPTVLAEIQRTGGISLPLAADRGLDLPPPIRELLFGWQFPPDRLFQSAEPDAYPSHRLFHCGYLYADPEAIATAIRERLFREGVIDPYDDGDRIAEMVRRG